MTERETYERLSRVETVLFGVEGVGGVMHQVVEIESRLGKVEQSVNTISVKLAVYLGIGSFALGKGLDLLMSYLPKLLH